MKRVKSLAVGAVLVSSLVGVSPAPAANWDPQNVNVTATQEGSGTLTAVSNVTCTAGDTTLRASGAVASTINTTNPVTFSGCSNPILGAATVTTFGTWTLTATSTTAVDITAVSATGVVAVISFGACSITVPSPVHIGANTWNNTNHTLAINSASSFGVLGHGICGISTPPGRLDANFVAPVATIT